VELAGERGDANEAPRAGLRDGEPACETRGARVGFARIEEPKPAREAGRWDEVFARTERLAEEEDVGIE
jgi:hypothetical protein